MSVTLTRLDPDAIAGAIAADAHTRVAEAVTLTLDWLEDQDRALNERQKIEFIGAVLRSMDGFERETLDEITRAIERADDA